MTTTWLCQPFSRDAAQSNVQCQVSPRVSSSQLAVMVMPRLQAQSSGNRGILFVQAIVTRLQGSSDLLFITAMFSQAY